jgi:hypothetical protein
MRKGSDPRVPKFSVSAAGVEVVLEDSHATMERLEQFAMRTLSEALKLEQSALIARGSTAVGFLSEKDTSKPADPRGITSMSPEIRS